MTEPLALVFTALAAFLGLKEVDPAVLGRGRIVSAFPDPSSPGEVVGNVLLVIDVPWSTVIARVGDPARQPGVLVGGLLDSTSASLDRFASTARLDDSDADRLRTCRPGQCRLKMTESLLAAQSALPESAAPSQRLRSHLLSLASLSACGRASSCEIVLIDRKAPVALAPVARRLRARPSLAGLLQNGSPVQAPPQIEWRTESYYKREVLTLGAVRVVEGQLGDHRALLHQREVVFATHYFFGARVETLFVEVAGRVVVAQSNAFQTDKTSGFNGIERALIRMLGGRRFEGQAAEWRAELPRKK